MPKTLTKKSPLLDHDLEELPSLAKLSQKERHAAYATYASKGQFFGVEYSSSSRSLCRSCRTPIAKDTVRLRHIVCGMTCCREGKTGVKDACGRWHVPCFLKSQAADPERFSNSNAEWKPVTDTQQLAGWSRLQAKDLEDLRAQLSVSTTAES